MNSVPVRYCLLLAACLVLGSGAAAQDGNLLISSFDGNKIELRSGLALWVFTDEQFGGTSEARATLIQPGADRSSGALRISFHVTEDAPNPFAGAWAMVGPEGLRTDLSAYRGVRLYARSTTKEAFTIGVVRLADRLRRYGAPLDTRPEWALIDVPFGTFREILPPGDTSPASAPPSTDITSVGFSVGPTLRGRFELDVDRIEFYR